ncbi:ATP synthase subunit B family protein [Nocardioides bizhenqiangii]|uniref:ATPase n=1 Tax=Nocardioides bizhenqiangii TaxID=3095076 RepID=A0ABZ0ZK12_9ACTN|nr:MULTISPECIES: hypothetical protein [unclassified Nocardioides]MDZ5620424.1 hypothetical protein [Nocardioides sp. HM23]WQQ24793.1 hypothetical protein SHK19_12530 [Nocardioides sp. HM61]
MADSATGRDTNDAAVVARDFRVSLEHRRDIDDLVADAVGVRQRATAEAVEIVRAAEALAREILADAREQAARLTTEAEQALEASTAARELAAAALGEKVSATIHRLESMASEVHMALDSALAEVSESLSPLTDRSPTTSGTTPPEPRSAPESVEEGVATAPQSRPQSGPKISGWTDNIPSHPVRGGLGPRSERWRDRFRQER